MTDQQGILRIGLLEHQDYITAEHFLREAFGRIGYEPKISRLKAEDLGNLATPKNIFSSEGFDVFASDISLGDTKNRIGLTVIREVKERWPDLYVIGISNSHVSYQDVSNKVPTFDVFVYKPMISDKPYFNYVTGLIRDGFRRNIFVQLDPTSSLDDELQKGAALKEVESIVKQITFTSHSADRSTVVSRVVLDRLEGGFSISKVYRLRAFTAADLACIHAVLKISKPEAAQREFENYMNYIDWYLPYTWRPDLLGKAFTRRWGAVCYAFAYGEGVPFQSLNSVIEAKEVDRVIEVAKKIFDPGRQRWFHSSNVREEKQLTTYYVQRWFVKRQVDLERLIRRLLLAYDLSDSEVVKIKGNIYRMPEGFLLGRVRNNYQSCIRHGDLHGGNLLVTETNDICFIDFQDTGRGHVFEDFIVFESSVRVQHEAGMHFEELLEGECIELIDEKSTLPFRDVLQVVRTSAKQNFPDETWSNYVYALALFSYRLLRIEELKEWQQEQLVACLFACIGWLEQNEEL